MTFTGSYVALVTPFRDGRLDEDGVSKLVSLHLRSKTRGVVPCATTGESPTVTAEEWKQVLKIVVGKAKGKLLVVAYTGTNDTSRTITRTQEAERLGADAALVVTPYYNRPSQEGLYQHFRAVAQNTKLPLLIYNVPSRTGVSIDPTTVCRLSELKNVRGIKEASGSLDQASQIIRQCPADFSVLSGEDSLTLAMLAVGAVGVISVVANVVPRDVASMIEAWEEGKTRKARQLHLKMLPLVKALFVETNPGPVKAAMNLLGLPAGDIRLPLVQPKGMHLEMIKEALEDYGVLK
jgi:4-hydroxy-tetrahydrodipicolinate synthase